MGRRGAKPQGRVDTTWRPELAYVVGLLASDGCLSNNGRHIDLTSADKDLLLTYQDCLGLRDIKIGNKKSGYSKNVHHRVQFGDVLFYQWLTDTGLTPNKSKTLAELHIPDEYFFDFLRGCWDGDGTIYAYWDPRWKSSYMYYLSIASASTPFLNWMQSTIQRLIGVEGKMKLRSQRGAYQLWFAKKKSKQVFDAMFYRDDLPCLHRKFAKAQKIFRIDATHNDELTK